MKLRRMIPAVVISLVVAGCSGENDKHHRHMGATEAEEAVMSFHDKLLTTLPFDNNEDFEQATKGLIASPESLIVRNQTGDVIWQPDNYSFVVGDSPESVNPSLWRQAKLNNIHGLFQVTDGIYQIRGFDLANMTLIDSDNGWIVVDPLTTKETAKAALSFARKHLGDKPIVAILFTHSHIDHFGGVLGILESSQGENVASQDIQIPIIAPEGFMEEATSENVIAGIAMGRRAMYMYGKRLPRSERGHIGSGLGKEPAMGKFGIATPNQLINAAENNLTIDGVKFEFQLVSGAEAPSEFTFYLPDKKAFCGAELVSRNMHNLYTLRGAKVRDGLLWSNYINESMKRFNEAEIYFGSHHWPVWGRDKIQHFLKQQRDTYKYIHDQTVRLLNQGLTPEEIAEQVKLPPSLQTDFNNRGYYGTVKHNVKAVYQGYLGWYNGNPAHLDPLPESATASRYIDLMGGYDNVLESAHDAFEDGDYRWASELLNKLVFAEPEDKDAKNLLARTYDQLGYLAESGPWRDVYLTAAFELRHDAPEKGVDIALMEDVLKQTPIPHFFDSMAVRLDGPAAEDENYVINIHFTDLQEIHVLSIENSVLHHQRSAANLKANATLHITHDLFIQMAIGRVGLSKLLFSDDISFEGSKIDLIAFFSLFDKPTGVFNIVTP